jgi:hypothetical protein
MPLIHHSEAHSMVEIRVRATSLTQEERYAFPMIFLIIA